MATKVTTKKKSAGKAGAKASAGDRKRSPGAAARTRTAAAKRPAQHARTGKSGTAGKPARPVAKSSGKPAAKPAPQKPAKAAAKPAAKPQPKKAAESKGAGKPDKAAVKASAAVRPQPRPAKAEAPRPAAPRPAPAREPAAPPAQAPQSASQPAPAQAGAKEAREAKGKALASAGAAKTAAAALKARPAAPEVVHKLPERPIERDPGFAEGDFVVYPTHGVGRVVAIETQQIAGISLPLIVITFDKDRMTLRVPVAKAHNSGLRKLSSRKVMDTALATLKGRSRVKRTMWSRRAQEYEAKINSGDPVSIAEVVRDLHRGSDQPDQSYSERQIYQAALDRLARELAAVEDIDEQAAAQRLEEVLKAA